MLRIRYLLALVMGLASVPGISKAANQGKIFECHGKNFGYRLHIGEINESPAELLICPANKGECSQVIQLDEDTDEETGSRNFVGTDKEKHEFWLEFVKNQYEGQPVEYWLSVERDGEVLDHQIDCNLK